jgi:glycerol-3-phosphate dehydrogenase
VTGGKLTTYRKMAEDTVDVVVRPRRVAQDPPLRHQVLRLIGATAATRDPGRHGPPACPLLGRYGNRVLRGAGPGRRAARAARAGSPGFPTLRAELLYAVREEMAGRSMTCWPGAPAP